MSASRNILRPGDRISTYEIDDVIGFGGMAVVYRARQLSLNRMVAIKVLADRLGSDESFRERFRREAVNAAALDHPNIVPIYEAGEDGGRAFIVMRLVEGDTLADQLVGDGVSGEQTLSILSPIADALDLAHRESLIHRDIKPQNILLTRTGHPYLADFGIAKGADTHGLTMTGNFIGSVNYASPEQIVNAKVTSASDIYALTVVLYQCLTGRVPFPRDTDAGVMHAHLNEPPPRLEDAAEAAPPGLSDVIARGLAKDPTERFAHAGELLEATERCLRTAGPDVIGRRPVIPINGGAAAPAEPAVPESFETRDAPRVGLRGAETVAPEPQAPVPAPMEATLAPDAAEYTSVDRRRVTPPREVPAPQRSRRTALTVLAGVGAAGLLAAGLVVGGGGEEKAPAPPRLANAGPLAVTLAADWKPAKAGKDALTVEHPVAFAHASTGAALLLGTLPAGADPVDPLKRQLARGGAKPPAPQRVRIGDLPALRYRAARSDAFVLTASTGQRLVVSCAGATAALADCDRAVGTLRANGVEIVAPGPSPELAAGLRSALASVSTAQDKQAAGLRSRHRAKREASARALARAYRAAGTAVARLDGAPGDAPAVKAVASALNAIAADFSRLAGAASSNSRAGYRNAAHAVARDRHALATALATLRRRGYTTTT